MASRSPIQLIYDGRERPYLLQAPQTPGTGRLPLLLELHGRGVDPTRFDQLTGFGSLADEAGFALALPSAVREIWNDGRRQPATGPDDVGYLAAVIDDVTARLPVDPGRVYVVGMSNGATMAGRLACELADRITAIAQVAGTAGVVVAASCRPSRPMPILNIHGTADDYAPYEGGTLHSLRGRVLLRHAGGPCMGVDEWAQFWAAANGALAILVTSSLPPDTTIRTWSGPTPSSDVVFYRVDDGGHTWPGSRFMLPAMLFGRTSRTFDATRLAWDFLARHAR